MTQDNLSPTGGFNETEVDSGSIQTVDPSMAPTGSPMTSSTASRDPPEQLSVGHMTKPSFGASEEPSPLGERLYIEPSRTDSPQSSHPVLSSGTQSQKLSPKTEHVPSVPFGTKFEIDTCSEISNSDQPKLEIMKSPEVDDLNDDSVFETGTEDKEAEAEVKAEVKSEAMSEAVPEAVPEAMSEAMPEAMPEAVPEAKPEAEAEDKSEVGEVNIEVQKAELIKELKADMTSKSDITKSESNDRLPDDFDDSEMTDDVTRTEEESETESEIPECPSAMSNIDSKPDILPNRPDTMPEQVKPKSILKKTPSIPPTQPHLTPTQNDESPLASSICDISPDPVLSQIEKKITESKTADEPEVDALEPEVAASEPEAVALQPEVAAFVPESASSEPEIAKMEPEAKLELSGPKSEYEIEPETETETLDNSEDSLKSPILSEKSEKLPISQETTETTSTDEKKDATKNEPDKSVPECTEEKNVEIKSSSDKTDFDYLNGEQFSDSRTVTDMKERITSV